MLPSRRQYKRWGLPAQWSFWAAVIGIPIGILSLLLSLWPLAYPNPVIKERNRTLLQTAQELRHNDEWLNALAKSIRNRSATLPPGSLKTDGLLLLIQNHHDWLLKDAYGEEKNLYQEILLFNDLSFRLGSPATPKQLEVLLQSLEYTLDDIHFLNNFLFWYIKPEILNSLSYTQLYSLGRNGLPDDVYEPPDGANPRMNHFVENGKPIIEYSTYLGLID